MQAVFSASAEYYDLVYGKKDYQGETDRLRGLLRRFVPDGRTILDIACGTGEHLRLLPEYQVAGIDLEPAFVRIASAKRSDGNFQVADMQRFDLRTKFDILICLFSAIAYLLTPEAILQPWVVLRPTWPLEERSLSNPFLSARRGVPARPISPVGKTVTGKSAG